jgi:pilus assembly protein CpaD
MTGRRPTSSRLPVGLLGACALAALAGACKGDPPVTGAIETADYRARHPIVLADGARNLDIFPTGPGHLDPRQTDDIDAFMLEYRRYGRGGLLMEVPRGLPPARAAATERTAGLVLQRAGQDGVGRRDIVANPYPVAAPELAAPIRLSFSRMQAKVAGDCGTWPQDTGASNFAFDNSNRPIWNFGCATQATIAAQIADPVDLVRGRPEGRIDSVKRIRDVGQLREGKDPSTQWRQDGQTSVKAQVGN